MEVARAKNVILYTTLSNKSQDRELNGLCGLLVVTNFKLSFLTQDNEQVNTILLLHCLFFPVPFSDVSFIYLHLEYYVSREFLPATQRCHIAKY